MIRDYFARLISWPHRVAALLAVLFQVQMTFGRTPDSLGLTLNTADLTLPVLGLTILVLLISGRSVWPRWRHRGLDLMMAVVMVTFMASLAWADHLTGTINDWAMMNRMAGWIVMAAYFYAGGWLVTNGNAGVIKTFFMTLAIGLALTLPFGIGAIVAKDLGLAFQKINIYPLDLTVGNRNLLAFMVLYTLLALGLMMQDRPTRLVQWLWFFLLMLMPLFTVMNGARGFMVILPLLVIFFLARFGSQRIKWVILPLILGSVILTLSTLFGTQVLRESQFDHLPTALLSQDVQPHLNQYGLAEADGLRHSDSVRALVYGDAWEYFTNHPVFGVGLGSSLTLQIQKYGRLIELIDSVPLWIVAEMGMVGLVVLGALGGIMAWALVPAVRSDDADQRFAGTLGLGIITIFVILGVVYQIFFIRSFWFIMGMLLALPRVVSVHGSTHST